MPQLTQPQMLAVAAVLAVVFWPKIKAYVEQMSHVPAAGKPKTSAAGAGRSPLVIELLDTQDAVRPINAKAADLIGQAAMLLIGGSPTK